VARHCSFTPEPELDVKFLEDLYSFGWYNQHVSAIVLYDAGANIPRYDQAKDIFSPMVEHNMMQKILRAKIFAEYIALR
jgi:hypothetical protein